MDLPQAGLTDTYLVAPFSIVLEWHVEQLQRFIEIKAAWYHSHITNTCQRLRNKLGLSSIRFLEMHHRHIPW